MRKYDAVLFDLLTCRHNRVGRKAPPGAPPPPVESRFLDELSALALSQ